MSNIKEIKNRINTIKETRKITNAMHLIASIKMRKVKEELDKNRPYFKSLEKEVKRIFRTVNDTDHNYFYPKNKSSVYEGTYGYLVITADKGLAGPYNLNVIKETMKLLNEHEGNKLYVVGEYGRRYFASHDVPIEKNFQYTAQNPTFDRAKAIADVLLDAYNKGELTKIHIVYTDLKSGINEEIKTVRLLPFHRKDFEDHNKDEDTYFEFKPNILEVLDTIIPSYLAGFIYSALVDSFCCEQSARMVAMDSANKNADKLIDDLTLTYNHLRQSAITQEITEVSAGAKNYNSNKGV